MGTIFNLDNKFFQGVSKLIDIICLSMIWLFLCAFIIPAGAATTALYYTINKVIRHGRGYMWSEFWKAFRSNFKQSTIVWLILMALIVFLGMDCYILWQYAEIGKTWGSAYMVFIVMMGFAIMWAIYLFPYMARFANTTKIVIKNTACIALLNLSTTIFLFILLVAVVLMTYFFTFLIVLAPGLYMWMANYSLEKVFRKYMSEEDIAEEDERNRDYCN